ncbi:protein of unknown function [Pseudodesulfovibrio piezophilus C1TLV30]|uniref:Uncharacterized protein n=1 Tax=Pseudodesulfovibrio piezophilus (strain DSM 21447 / JCM 15486 / C1TLV30) TaxID=1322246 RepID=M1WT49_PSEP2|nr:protein of unknown function [Pseudodesulfovibrio piezophilus C1TLV30]
MKMSKSAIWCFYTVEKVFNRCLKISFLEILKGGKTLVTPLFHRMRAGKCLVSGVSDFSK